MATTRCSYQADTGYAQRHRATGGPIARGREIFRVEANVSQCVGGQELPGALAKRVALTAKPLELAQREHDGHGLAASGEFGLLAGFGQIDDAWGDPECAWLESFWRALRGRTASHLVAES